MEQKNRRIVQLKRRPDLVEVVQLCLEALVKWKDNKPLEELNMALSELKDSDVEIKSIERSEAYASVLLFMNDGTSYSISVARLDNNFRR